MVVLELVRVRRVSLSERKAVALAVEGINDSNPFDTGHPAKAPPTAGLAENRPGAATRPLQTVVC